MENPQEYFQHHGPMTSVDAHAANFSALPRDLAALCEVIQGVLIHRDMAAFALESARELREMTHAHS